MTNANTTAADWAKAEWTLELGADILPVVPAGAIASELSKVKRFGKIPSIFGGDGCARGLSSWQAMEVTAAHLRLWSQEPRYSMCVRASVVRAIDVDVTDPELARRIFDRICAMVPGDVSDLQVRTRLNSSKFLMPFKLATPLAKRVIRVGPKQQIELLADGQQWLLCGMHESGVRYEWNGHERLPDGIPMLTLEQLEQVWTMLKTEFAVSTDPTDVIVRKDATDAPERPGEVLIAIPDTTLTELLDALNYPALCEASDDNSLWNEIGYALLSLDGLGRDLWFAFKRGGSGHENTAASWWDAHRTQAPRSDYRHIFTLAARLGWKRPLPPVTVFPIVQPYEIEFAKANAPLDDLVPALPDNLNLIPAEPEKPIIRIQGGELDAITRRCEEIADIFVQGDVLVRFGKRVDVHDGFERDPHAQPLVRASMEYLRCELTARATFLQYDGRIKDWKVVDCPKDIAQTIVSRRHWGKLRQMTAVVRAPFMRIDGTICTTIGYDEQSRVMYVRSIDFPPIPEHPTREQALVALDMLLAPFDQFPMSSRASRSAFAAHLLTEVARTAMPTSPMFWYSATTAGTGKTLLSEMASMIAYGTAPAAKPWVEGEEMRKSLFAALIAGDRAIRFDNLANGMKFRSSYLCSFLTAPLYSDRKLGVSETLSIPNRAVVIATGNNIIPSDDLARRSLVVRMDANMPARQLRERTFRIDDIHGYVTAHRAELLVAALTILRAHQQSDYVAPVQPMQSFVEWSKLVRNALLWLGMEDPLGTQETETDDEASDSLGALFAKMHAVTKGEVFYSINLVGSDNELLQALISSGCDGMDAKKIGMWLAARRGVVAGDYKLVDHPRTLRGKPWQMMPRDGAFGDLL